MYKHSLFAAAAVSLLSAVLSVGVRAQEWGDLEGQFIYKGTPPTPMKIVPDKDVEFCGKVGLVREDVVVNKQNGGIANIVVYLFPAAGQKIKIHPDAEKPPAEKLLLDNKKCRFDPHVMGIRAGQTLVIGNSDPFGHNTKAAFFENAEFNDTIPAGGKIEKVFSKGETAPTAFECSIHNSWMKAYVLVRDNPYFAVTDKDGKFSIKNIPVGEHTFIVWHETGYLVDVTVDGKPTKWQIGTRAKGRVKVNIKPGANLLGKKIEAAPVPK